MDKYESHSIRISQYFLDPYEHSVGNVKIESDLHNYATKVDLKGGTGIDTSTLASKQIWLAQKLK